MSLKAKLEAVIYAAEEPVTLAQLAALFADEALAWKAERAAAVAEQEQEASEALPLQDGFAYLGLEADDSPRPEPESVATGAPVAEPAAETADLAVPVAETASVSDTAAQDETAASDPEADAKREARVRDREVRAVLKGLIDELIAAGSSDERGMEIREIAGGYRMATKPEYHDAVRSFVRSLKPPLKLSLQALETLAVVAYKQPVTAPEVSEIRGVESAGTLGSLLSRKLIATAGRKPVIGRPILYKTTREFLLRFGLKDVAELPSMEEFEKMATIELDEQAQEPDGEAAAEASQDANVEAEVDEAGDEHEQAGGEATHLESASDPASTSPQPQVEVSPHGS